VPSDDDPEMKQRDFVWIWYDTLPADTSDFTDALTDVDGKTHPSTVPRGKMRPEVWQRVLDRKVLVKNPYFRELMEKVEQPFVSAIRDFKGTKSVFYDGSLLLAGDAFTMCRPHGGGSTSQAAFQAQTLVKVLEGEKTLEQWEEACLASAEKAAQFSMAMAQLFWKGKVPGLP
jgi:2-polyprenyl-6-methoxyphenol hydroxylase-like FAD-dependent oxidoreductase